MSQWPQVGPKAGGPCLGSQQRQEHKKQGFPPPHPSAPGTLVWMSTEFCHSGQRIPCWHGLVPDLAGCSEALLNTLREIFSLVA